MAKQNVIPKIVHYCWFGRGPKPKIAEKCIKSWGRHLKDYQFIEWNEDNFDVSSNLYVEQAYTAKKYAFVTDVVRLYALYNFGGVYMDMDVEVLKPLDRFLTHRAFSGFEDEAFVPTGIMAAEKGNEWIKGLLDYYADKEFINDDGSYNMVTNTVIITESCRKQGLIQNGKFQELNNGVVFYPRVYFSPYDYKNGESYVCENSYTIHHFSQTWLPWYVRYRRVYKIWLMKVFGQRRIEKVISLMKHI